MGNLVRLARRRILGNQLFAQGANAAIAALAVFILLLLFGTQILSWQLALTVPLAAAAFGIYRVKLRTPSHYAVAATARPATQPRRQPLDSDIFQRSEAGRAGGSRDSPGAI